MKENEEDDGAVVFLYCWKAAKNYFKLFFKSIHCNRIIYNIELIEWRTRTYFVYFEWRYQWYYKIYKIIKRFECINWWSYWNRITATVKDETKKQEGGFLGALLAPLTVLLVQPVISSVIKGISGRGVWNAEKGYVNKIF